MGGYCKIKKEVLKHLREASDNMLYSIGDDERNQVIEKARDQKATPEDIKAAEKAKNILSSNLIHHEIVQIRNHHSDMKKAENWGKRLKYARTMAGYSQEEVATILNVPREIVSQEENNNAERIIDITWLEACSLLYHILPFDLVKLEQRICDVTEGKSKEEVLDMTTAKDVLMPAVYLPDAFCMGCKNVIMNALYIPENRLNIQVLHMIAVIGVLQKETFLEVFHDLSDSVDFPELDSEWFDLIDYYRDIGTECQWVVPEVLPKDINYNQRNSWEYTAHYVYFEAQQVLDYLVFRQLSSRLKFLAQIAELGTNQLELLSQKLKLEKYMDFNHHILDGFLDFLDREANACRGYKQDSCWGICRIPAGASLFPSSLEPKLDLTAHLLKF